MSKTVTQQLSLSGGVFPGFEKSQRHLPVGPRPRFRAHLAQPLAETWGAVGWPPLLELRVLALEVLAGSGPQFWQSLTHFSLHPGPDSVRVCFGSPFSPQWGSQGELCWGSGFGPFPSSIRCTMCLSAVKRGGKWLGQVQAKQGDFNFCFLIRLCISSSWEQLLFLSLRCAVRGMTELQVQRLCALPVCAGKVP